MALLLAGAEPEELATVVVASLRGSPGIALGDVIGANIAICLVALGVGAAIAPLPFRASGMRYSILGLPLGVIAVSIAWDGAVTRSEGAVLVGLYIIHVGAIWIVERRPPALGEVHELEEAEQAAANPDCRQRAAPSVPLLIDDSQVGADLRVCADDEDGTDNDQRG